MPININHTPVGQTTLQPPSGAGSATVTLPSSTTTLAGIGIAQTFTAAQTFRAASAVRSEAASTQDAVVIAGRAGGTSSYAVTVTPDVLTANRTFTLPDNSGTVLTTGSPLIVNSTTVSASYTVASGQNAMSVGPITVNSGVTVTVSSGQRWLVL